MSEEDELTAAIVEWEAAFVKLADARDRLREASGDIPKDVVEKNHEEALKAYNEATEKRLLVERRFLEKE